MRHGGKAVGLTSGVAALLVASSMALTPALAKTHGGGAAAADPSAKGVSLVALADEAAYDAANDPENRISLSYQWQKTYDGEVLEAPQIVDDGSGTSTPLVEGVDFDLRYVDENDDAFEGLPVDAGSYTMTVTFKGAYAGEFAYDVTIDPRELTVVTPAKTRLYNGEPLFIEDGEIELRDLVEGEKLPVTCNALLVNAGTWDWNPDGDFELGWYADAATAKERNYVVSYDLGDLSVTKAKLVIGSHDATKVYDGTELAVDGDDIYEVGLAEGEDLEFLYRGSQTDVGSSDVEVVLSWDAPDTTANPNNYEVAYELGTLTVTPAPLAVTTPSARKAYDGTALTAEAGAKLEGLVAGETAKLVATGSRTEVGSSDNGYRIEWNGTARKGNYQIAKERIGTLTVDARDGATPGKPSNPDAARRGGGSADKLASTGDPTLMGAPALSAAAGIAAFAAGLCARRRRDDE